jgi:ATP-binding cassette subfamily G (WHITE) protein 2
MKRHPLGDDEKENIVLCLLRQVGSVHDNIAFTESIPSELTNHQHIPSTDNLHDQITTTNRIDPQSITISFHEINYHVGQKTKRKIFPCCKSKTNKQILFNVTGGFSPGMNAILGKYITNLYINFDDILIGPSGCGKSSLLDILADRKDKNGLSGRVLVSGKPRSKTFRYSIGYVVQEGKQKVGFKKKNMSNFFKDIISGILSVRENLMFSANVRLPRTTTKTQRIELVNKIIRELGLEKCADTRIGTHFIRGVSGGEKRRACIGMELVLSPNILFLDEPTSGKSPFILILYLFHFNRT